MRYLLVVVTHGASLHLDRALHSFSEWVTPRPVLGLLWIDGPDVADAAVSAIRHHGDWVVTGSEEQRGFCNTYTDAWDEAVIYAEQHDCDFVFWLESDFLVRRSVSLEALAGLLASDHSLAQVALMRNACNPEEAAAGGLFESRPGEYSPESFTNETASASRVRIRGHSWLRHRSYFTTNPNLMRRDFMASCPWPGRHVSDCEGLYTMDLRELGFDFAVWGSGEPWVEHIGVRTGFGY
jgi:hypothetical protein